MAKVRLYELAKDLNMDSKQLVEKLKTGGMVIKNYMSTLDESEQKKAREIVNGVTSEVVEEKRIKQNVIRRRKKVVQVEKAEHETEEEKEDELETAEKAVEPSTEVKEEMSFPFDEKEVAREEEPSPEMETETVEEEVEEKGPEKVEAEKVHEKPKSKKVKIKSKDTPAKIIKRPEEGPLKDVLTRKKTEEPPAEKIAEKVVSVEPEITAEPPASDTKEKPHKKKKGKKKSEKKVDDDMIRLRHRKLEVFERADLYEDRRPRLKEKKTGKKSKETVKGLRHTEITTPKAIKRRLKVQENVTVSELARAMGTKAVELIKKLMTLGTMANINMAIDFETASVVADDFGYELELDNFKIETMLDEAEDSSPDDLKPRPPVVTIMGHVDHGKTSLLDYIRQSNIIGGESGGITQHIGAYYVETKGGDIAFLDTPGHEAFTAMRARGAKVTDIIILVVAADDGVMPQTKEAINHARAANIPIIVAINKIDKPEANPDKVTRELADLNLVPEDWGGDTIFGKISAKTGEGVKELMELILLQSEMLELKANPDKPAKGTIIEAKLDKSKGSLATVLIQEGTLYQSDYFICGENYGRVRAMLNNRGKKMEKATPSVPVEIYGISGVPMAGDKFYVVKDEKIARQIVDHRLAKIKEKERTKSDIVSLDDLYEKIKEGAIKELNIIIKADVQGSIEALSESLNKLGTDEVKIRIIHASTGAITESDVMLASASAAIIIGFRVRANPRVVHLAEKENIDIRYYDVIYNLIEDIKNAMAGLLDPILKENVIGRVDVKEVFSVPKVGKIAGCYVTDGHIERNAKVRLLRDDVVVFDGKISSLRRFQNDVKDVQSGYECGIGIESYHDIKPGDVLEVYQVEEIKAEL